MNPTLFREACKVTAEMRDYAQRCRDAQSDLVGDSVLDDWSDRLMRAIEYGVTRGLSRATFDNAVSKARRRVMPEFLLRFIER